jgi:hypothetical protein
MYREVEDLYDTINAFPIRLEDEKASLYKVRTEYSALWLGFSQRTALFLFYVS